MPGILPMKVIKVGSSSAQTRIAQACDRCRSKKIRCDGLTPTCSQCANVGFECKTSDKLSRRAFPRGYTESLEDRVRSLETEVKELKDLLDEKDEKIDMLSKMHSQNPASPRKASLTTSLDGAHDRRGSVRSDKGDIFKLQQSPFLLGGGETDAYFMGTSSGCAFIDAFKRKLQESGKACPELDSHSFFPSPSKASLSPVVTGSKLPKPPPRLLSDQMVNIYFQEWAPLFPVIHRPTFLALYHRYVSDPGSVTDKRSIAQLNLVFGIAALSKESQTPHCAELCEEQWSSAMEAFTMEVSLAHLQCLILAQIYCLQKGSSTMLLHYKGLAVGIAQRLGLHLSQKRWAMGALTIETRKKVFWTLYTLDCFSAAFLGLPKLLGEDDIQCEYPVDADDEYVTEQGFQPTLPGEFTKISSALALFRGARVLSKVLEQNYPAAASQDLSLRNIGALDEELETWSNNLAPHLRMEFVQDKPSTQVVSSRCPLLSLTYHYIRTLIHRPPVCAILGDKASSSIVALASSSKHIIQLLGLLDERNLSFSHCINKNELLTLSAFGILFQALDLEKDSKLMKDNGKSIRNVIEMLDRRSAPGTTEFKRVSYSVLPGMRITASNEKSPTQGPMSATKTSKSASLHAVAETQKQLQALAARYTLAAGSSIKGKPVKEVRRTSTSALPSKDASLRPDTTGFRPIAPSFCRSTTLSPRASSSSTVAQAKVALTLPSPQSRPSASFSMPNLDYLALPGDPGPPPLYKVESNPEGTVWDSLLYSLDERRSGSRSDLSCHGLSDESLLSPSVVYPSSLQTSSLSDCSWSPEIWDFGLEQFNNAAQPAPQSVLSFSDESLTSGEDFSSIDMGSTGSEKAFGAMMIPHYTSEEFSSDGISDLDSLQASVAF